MAESWPARDGPGLDGTWRTLLRWLYDQQQLLPLPDNLAKLAKELARRLDSKQRRKRVPRPEAQSPFL